MPSSRPLPPPITISVAFVRGLLGNPAVQALPLDALLTHAGITPSLLEQTCARVSTGQFLALVCMVRDQLNDEGVGLFQRKLRRGSVALMAESALLGKSLPHAIERLCRTFNLLQDDARFVFNPGEDHWQIEMVFESQDLLANVFAHEVMVCVIWRMLTWLHGARLRGTTFEMALAPPAHAGEYTRLLPVRIHFERATTAITFNAPGAAHVWRKDRLDAGAFIASMPGVLVAPQRLDRSMSARVRALLLKSRPYWPDLETVASSLGKSVSSVQRQLALEGITFRELKDQLRRDIAIDQLTGTRQPLAEVAELLGFSDSATFQRAFKEWTGSAPGKYRDQRVTAR